MPRPPMDAEKEMLRARIVELEARLAEKDGFLSGQTTRHGELVAEQQKHASMLQAIFASIADAVVVCDPAGNLTHFNAAAEDILGMGKLDVPLPDWSAVYGIFRPDGVTQYPSEELPLARARGGETVDHEAMIVRRPKEPSMIWIQVSSRPLRLEDGTIAGAVAVFHDMSDRKRWEDQLEAQLAREKERNDALERLQQAVTDLSTPILEVWDDVLALPVIGVVDSRRSADMMERLLDEITRTQCRFVILDVTGVDVVDTSTADRFIRLVHAVQLIGARCMLTGIRSAVAQTLVSLGLDLGSLTTLRTLKHGLRECMRLMAAEQDRQSPRHVLTAGRAS